VGEGLDIVEHPISAADAGPLERHAGHGPVLAVIRGGETLRFDDARVATLEVGDVVLELRSQDDGTSG
jgi:hypothetical protein